MKHTKVTNKNLAWVLASANEMIEESLYHCETFAHTLNSHHNEAAAAVFEQIQPSFRQEQMIVLEKLQGIDLPEIPPWEVPHQDYEHPALSLMEAHYLMTEAEAWKMVSEMVQIHGCFYNHLLAETQMEEIKKLVSKLSKHCLACKEIITNNQQNSDHQSIEDLDPPIDQ